MVVGGKIESKSALPLHIIIIIITIIIMKNKQEQSHKA
jgi:hypothetical protein